MLEEQARLNDVLLFEERAEFGWCRKAAVLSKNTGATADVEIGTVLENDSGDFVPCTTGANANGILLTHVTQAETIAADVDVIVLYRGPALLKDAGIVVGSTILTAAKAALAILGIEVRTTPTKYEEGLD